MQIEAYLKTVEMRRSIDKVHKEAAAKAGFDSVTRVTLASERTTARTCGGDDDADVYVGHLSV